MIDPRVTRLEAKRVRHGITAQAMLKRAGVPASTLWRWIHKGLAPTKPKLTKLKDALDALIKEQPPKKKDKPHG